MHREKRNFQDFYNEIRQKFPMIELLDTWVKYDWSFEGYEHSSIMTEVSREMGKWVSEGRHAEAQRLLEIIEKYFDEGDVPLTSIIYSDFLVTIMELKKESREVIKRMMGPQTKRLYIRLLNLYRESGA